MKQKFADIFSRWESQHGSTVVDKDAAVEKKTVQRQMRSRSYIESLKPEATIDLHGLTQDEAWESLNSFVYDAKRRGLRKILIIHGKGIHSGSTGGVRSTGGVLGEVVRRFIEYDQRLGASGHASREHGGSGATWVIVKN